MRKLKKHEYVLLGIFLFVAGFPLATATDGWSFDVVPLGSVLTPHQVLEIRENQVEVRRANAKVRRLCMKRVGEDATVECPDINNAVEVERFLLGKPLREEAATETGVMVRALRMTDLGQSETAMLRRFKRAGNCPQGLDAIIPGFNALCIETIGTAVPMLEDIVRVRAFERESREDAAINPTLNMRLEMFKGARPDR